MRNAHAPGLLLFLVFLTSGVRAQLSPTVGVYFDREGTQRTLGVDLGVPFSAWILVENAVEGMEGIELDVSVPGGVWLYSAYVTHPCVAIDCAWGQPDENGWLVGFGECYASESMLSLIRLDMLVLDETSFASGQICVVPPGRGSLDPLAPAYWTCADEFEVKGMALTASSAQSPAGCARVHLAGVGTTRGSWSTLKADHAGQR